MSLSHLMRGEPAPLSCKIWRQPHLMCDQNLINLHDDTFYDNFYWQYNSHSLRNKDHSATFTEIKALFVNKVFHHINHFHGQFSLNHFHDLKCISLNGDSLRPKIPSSERYKQVYLSSNLAVIWRFRLNTSAYNG